MAGFTISAAIKIVGDIALVFYITKRNKGSKAQWDIFIEILNSNRIYF